MHSNGLDWPNVADRNARVCPFSLQNKAKTLPKDNLKVFTTGPKRKMMIISMTCETFKGLCLEDNIY